METGIDRYRIARRRMVKEQLRSRGISSPPILEAFYRIPRHLFVDQGVRRRAYEDCSIPIAHSQTISQPFIIAFMIQALGVQPDHRVLEIGTGSGYQTAILSHIAREVYSIERITALSRRAEEILKSVPTGRIKMKTGDGMEGWSYYAPFDRIIISAGSPEKPRRLIEQLDGNGSLIAPIRGDSEHLVLYRKVNGRITEKILGECLFVPVKRGIE